MAGKQHSVEMAAIGKVTVQERDIPRHWNVSEVEGWLVLEVLKVMGDRIRVRGLDMLKAPPSWISNPISNEIELSIGKIPIKFIV